MQYDGDIICVEMDVVNCPWDPGRWSGPETYILQAQQICNCIKHINSIQSQGCVICELNNVHPFISVQIALALAGFHLLGGAGGNLPPPPPN